MHSQVHSRTQTSVSEVPLCYAVQCSGADELPEEVGTLKLLQTLDMHAMKVSKMVPSVGLLTQLLCLRLRNMVETARWDWYVDVPRGAGYILC